MTRAVVRPARAAALTTLVALLAAPCGLRGQERSASPPGDPVTTSFKFMAGRYGGLLQAALDSIPADRYSFRPTPAQQTIGYIAQHVNEANYALCERLGGATRPPGSKTSASDSMQALWPKDSLTARLRTSLRFCDAAMARMNDAMLGQRISYGPAGSGATALPARSLLLFVTDLAEHYSQVAGYMRLLGLVPPSALPPRPRHAVEIPTSVLQRYVGTYALAPSTLQDAPALSLVVTLEGGVLSLTPQGRPAVRLWAETPVDFFVKDVDAQVSFVADAKGAITGLVVHQNGEDRRAVKTE